ncbi:Uncharacterised protein (plasmid) [Mesomycoplasma hyorhinis]|nr:hypothetical protein EIH16_07560 [Mesomycoplasma hyorhinis]VEU57736.1 Uncharacterised protein [Mesomycoplasma hyorhinis]
MVVSSSNVNYNVSKNENFKFLIFHNYPLLFQGWKIHIAPRIRDYYKVIKIIYTYCVNNFLEFKHLKTIN